MNGLAIDTFEAFESLPEVSISGDSALQIDADIIRNPSFSKKYDDISCSTLIVRNPVPPRLNRLILESSFKLQTDYLESLENELDNYQKQDVRKILLDFDLPGVLTDESKSLLLRKILLPIKGMTYSRNIDLELLFRIPFNGMEDFVSHAAFFRQNSMLNLNYALDLHIHEAGFDHEELEDLLLPIRYDTGTVNFIYEAGLGNKINSQNLKKIMEQMREKGSNCTFFLCPSGNINFQSIREDLQQWLDMEDQTIYPENPL